MEPSSSGGGEPSSASHHALPKLELDGITPVLPDTSSATSSAAFAQPEGSAAGITIVVEWRLYGAEAGGAQ